LLLVILISAVWLVPGDLSEASDTDCEAAKSAYVMNKRRLGEYLVALERAQSRGETNLAEILNRKISELLEQIVNAENQGECNQKISPQPPHGVTPVKTDENEYAAKSCDELKVVLVRLMRKTSHLKRRAGSTFSDLSPLEKQEYDEAAQELKSALAATQLKCGGRKAAAPGREGQKRSKAPQHAAPARPNQ